MEKLPYKIIASSKEEFDEISEALKGLPKKVTDQISTVENGLAGLECKIKQTFGKKDIFLPNSVTQMTNFNKYFGIYSGDFFFKIEWDWKSIEDLRFIFVPIENKL